MQRQNVKIHRKGGKIRERERERERERTHTAAGDRARLGFDVQRTRALR